MKYYKKMIIRLTNDFHDSVTVLQAFSPVGSDAIYITRRQARRAWEDLCGIKGCTCGDVAGCRPQQAFELSPDPGPDTWIELQEVKIVKVLNGLYVWEYPATKAGHLIKQ